MVLVHGIVEKSIHMLIIQMEKWGWISTVKDLMISHGIGPCYYKKFYLQVNNIYGKVGVNIHG